MRFLSIERSLSSSLFISSILRQAALEFKAPSLLMLLLAEYPLLKVRAKKCTEPPVQF
jgi:hypothetical protein